jgi:hypothetical protein
MRTQILNWRQRCTNHKVDTAVRFQPGQNTVGLCPVRVTHLPKRRGSVFWPCNELNRTESPAKIWTPVALPGPVSNTHSMYSHHIQQNTHYSVMKLIMNGVLMIRGHPSWVITLSISWRKSYSDYWLQL